MKKLSSRGFGIVETILIILLVGALAGGGYYIFSKNKKSKPQATQSVTKPNPQPTAEASNDQFLEIKEWGVKIKNVEANKLTYKYYGEASEDNLQNKSESNIALLFKAQYLEDPACEPGVGVNRAKTAPAGDPDNAKKIGDYYYWTTGAPGPCSNDGTGRDDTLKSAVLGDFKITNLQAN